VCTLIPSTSSTRLVICSTLDGSAGNIRLQVVSARVRLDLCYELPSAAISFRPFVHKRHFMHRFISFYLSFFRYETNISGEFMFLFIAIANRRMVLLLPCLTNDKIYRRHKQFSFVSSGLLQSDAALYIVASPRIVTHPAISLLLAILSVRRFYLNTSPVENLKLCWFTRSVT
jgi:hypothetical protein